MILRIWTGMFIILVTYYLWNYLKFVFPLPVTVLLMTLILGILFFYLLLILDKGATKKILPIKTYKNA